MSKVLVTESYLSDIADAIRTKSGGGTTYKPSEMASAILSLPSGGSEWTQLCDVTTTEEAILQIPITGISVKEVRIYILQPASYSSTVVIYCPLNNPEGNHYDKGYGRLMTSLSASTASGGKAYMMSQLPIMIDNVAEEQQSDGGVYYGNAANMRIKFGAPSNVVAGQTFTSLSIATYQAIPAGLRIVAFGR